MVQVSVRPASRADLESVWEWRNDRATRDASFQRRAIPLAEHRTWFLASLENPGRHLLIAQAPAPIGVTRFDAIGGGRWTAHVNLAPQWRGRGLAADVMRRSVQWLVEHAVVDEIIAETRDTNERSQRVFLAAGFKRDDSADAGKILLRWRPTPPKT